MPAPTTTAVSTATAVRRITLEECTALGVGIILLLGQTGGGKSSIANSILGDSCCRESSKMKSCTDDLEIYLGRFFGNLEEVIVIDTPGFLDSENRDAEFLSNIVGIMKHFPRNQLKVVVVTLPLTETRAKATTRT